VTDPTSGVLVVTGASSGIGRATALELARTRWNQRSTATLVSPRDLDDAALRVNLQVSGAFAFDLVPARVVLSRAILVNQ
jgi:NAD(P)-dependent dehydrogenase (short-subunit alcohol dehydrogenase family)